MHRHGHGSIFYNPTQPNPWVYRPNPTQLNIEQQYNVFIVSKHVTDISMSYFTTVAVMFLKFCNRLFVISYPESRLIIEAPARHRHRTISIASTVLGDSRARASVIVRPTNEKSRSDWAELAEIVYKEPVSPLLTVGEILLHFLARRLVV